ncbi:hypothetical protein MP638_003803 [Amoeboaphelidium occidentale]|nr:hypothetical protein MP638_003803 [Amoeboaphelidium occidentale]
MTIETADELRRRHQYEISEFFFNRQLLRGDAVTFHLIVKDVFIMMESLHESIVSAVQGAYQSQAAYEIKFFPLTLSFSFSGESYLAMSEECIVYRLTLKELIQFYEIMLRCLVVWLRFPHQVKHLHASVGYNPHSGDPEKEWSCKDISKVHVMLSGHVPELLKLIYNSLSFHVQDGNNDSVVRRASIEIAYYACLNGLVSSEKNLQFVASCCFAVAGQEGVDVTQYPCLIECVGTCLEKLSAEKKSTLLKKYGASFFTGQMLQQDKAVLRILLRSLSNIMESSCSFDLSSEWYKSVFNICIEEFLNCSPTTDYFKDLFKVLRFSVNHDDDLKSLVSGLIKDGQETSREALILVAEQYPRFDLSLLNLNEILKVLKVIDGEPGSSEIVNNCMEYVIKALERIAEPTSGKRDRHDLKDVTLDEILAVLADFDLQQLHLTCSLTEAVSKLDDLNHSLIPIFGKLRVTSDEVNSVLCNIIDEAISSNSSQKIESLLAKFQNFSAENFSEQVIKKLGVFTRPDYDEAIRSKTIRLLQRHQNLFLKDFSASVKAWISSGSNVVRKEGLECLLVVCSCNSKPLASYVSVFAESELTFSKLFDFVDIFLGALVSYERDLQEETELVDKFNLDYLFFSNQTWMSTVRLKDMPDNCMRYLADNMVFHEAILQLIKTQKNYTLTEIALSNFSYWAGIDEMDRFLHSNAEYFVPRIISIKDADVVNWFVKYVKNDELLLKNAYAALHQIFMFHSGSSREFNLDQDILAFFMSQVNQGRSTNLTLSYLLFSNAQKLINLVFFDLGSNVAKAWNSITAVHAILSSDEKISSNIYLKMTFQGFLSSFLLGYIHFIVKSKLSDAQNSASKRIVAAKSLREIITKAGAHCDSKLSRIISLLSQIADYQGTGSEDIREECANAWLTVVKSFSNQAILHVFHEIVINIVKISARSRVSVYNFLHNKNSVFMKKTLEALEYLFVTQRQIFKETMKKAFYFPRQEKFYVEPSVNRISQSIHTCHVPNSEKEMSELLSSLENYEENSSDMIELILTEIYHLVECSADVLNVEGKRRLFEIIVNLLSLGSNLSENVKVCAINLVGLVGAIDLSGHDLKGSRAETKCTFDLTRDDSIANFVMYLLLKHLYPLYKTAPENFIQDRASYVIQELLRAAGVSGADDVEDIEDKVKQVGRKCYQEKIPAIVQNTFQPLLSSSYKIQFLPDEEYPVTIYSFSNTFADWLSGMTIRYMNFLLFVIERKKLSGFNLKRVLTPLKAVTKGAYIDVNISKDVLPTLILSNLKLSSDNIRGYLVKEFMSVFKGEGSKNQSKHSQVVVYVFELLQRLQMYYASQEESSSIVEAILSQMPLETLSKASFDCGLYYRSLYYFENLLRNSIMANTVLPKSTLTEYLSRMQKIYLNLASIEPDGLNGIIMYSQRLGGQSTLDSRIIEYSNEEKWPQVQSSYETLLHDYPDNPKYLKGLKESLKHLGNYDTLLKTESNKIGCEQDDAWEAVWKLQKWDFASDCSENSDNAAPSFNFCISKMLQTTKDHDALQKLAVKSKLDIATVMMEKGFGGELQRCQEAFIKCQMLYEVESKNSRTSLSIEDLTKYIDSRIHLTENSLKIREPLIYLFRTVYGNMYPAEVSGTLWLQQAKLARKFNNFLLAENCLLHAQVYNPPGISVERAKLLYSLGETKKALAELESVIVLPEGTTITQQNLTRSPSYGSNNDEHSQKDSDYYQVKALLLYAKWLYEKDLKSNKDIQAYYKKAVSQYEKSEKAYFHYGSFFNKILEESTTMKLQRLLERQDQGKAEDRNAAAKELQDCFMLYSEQVAYVIKNYARSLQFGNKFLFQSLPRLLTLWLDYSEQAADSSKNPSIAAIRLKTIASLDSYCVSLEKKSPVYIFLPVLRQLVSRVCHPHESSWLVMSKILVKVLLEYPHQALWHLVPGLKSTADPGRVRRCTEVINNAKEDKTIKVLRKDYLTIVEQFLNICNYVIPEKENKKDRKGGQVNHLTISGDFPSLKRLVPINVILPIQDSLTPSLSSSMSSSPQGFKAFGDNLPTIHSFKDKIQLMNSLQRPRKVGIFGTDGKLYNFLCKPKDDLRKDCRVIDFFSVINTLFERDTESKRRNLKIRTYAVMPLNEECGLIEWVPNTNTIRNVFGKLYKEKKVQVHLSVDAWQEALRQKKHLQYFSQNLLKPHQPPVFHSWFVKTFTDPKEWFMARNRWTRTIAIMSIVGFILGLGDRHSENILIDESTGDAVHVDFNCLFEKGLVFDYPERVPFRLTHNVVDAFGVTETDGIYTKTCELVLALLRSNEATLMSVLEAFVHDPLLEFHTSSKKSGAQTKSERAKQQARTVLMNISSKLRGGLGWTYQFNVVCDMYGKSSSNAKNIVSAASGSEVAIERARLHEQKMSVEGQVQVLIQQARSYEYMSQMWIGWSAYY